MLFCCHSSFNDKPINEGAIGPIGKELFEREQEDLLNDLKDIPKKACDRRVLTRSLYCGDFYCEVKHDIYVMIFTFCRSMNL